jgi:restriction system protein
VLAESPPCIDNEYLSQFAELIQFRERSRVSEKPVSPHAADIPVAPLQAQTPDELLRNTVKQIETVLAKELLDRILVAPPAFFERLIVKLLLALGYGGPHENSGRIVGQSGDGGIDGVIDQDALGLDRVYVQAKRYAIESAVSEPEIRAFSGSLGAAKASKGVFVTTSYFTQPARSFAERHPFRIVLIDGEQLATLMIRHNVDVRIDETLYLKKVDEDFFWMSELWITVRKARLLASAEACEGQKGVLGLRSCRSALHSHNRGVRAGKATPQLPILRQHSPECPARTFSVAIQCGAFSLVAVTSLKKCPL